MHTYLVWIYTCATLFELVSTDSNEDMKEEEDDDDGSLEETE